MNTKSMMNGTATPGGGNSGGAANDAGGWKAAPPSERRLTSRRSARPGASIVAALFRGVAIVVTPVAIATPAGAADGVKASGLIAHWSFDTDASSSVNNAFYRGELRGGASRVDIDRAPGAAKVGAGALRIASGRRGTERGYAAVENPLWGDPGTGVLCLSAWFKLSDLGKDGMDTTNMICESFPTLSSVGIGVRTEGKTKRATFRFRTMDYRMYSDAKTSAASTPATLRPEHTKVYPDADATVKEGEWQHVVLVWNGPGGRIRFYVGGQLEREITLPKGTRIEYARGLHIGTNRIASGSGWDGWIDDLAAYDVELTAKQVKALAAGNFEGRPVSAANVLAVVRDATIPAVGDGARNFSLPGTPAPENSAQDPLIGHVSEREAVLWARVPFRGTFAAIARNQAGHTVRATAEAVEAGDWCLRWELRGLQAAMEYAVTFERPAACPFPLAPLTLRTPPPAEQPGVVTLGFGSCSDYPDSSIWTRIAQECRDGMVLMGDTPYIDTTELRWSRWAYRRFASTPQFAAAFRRIPFWGTWDDHDFGSNDSDGRIAGKEFSRQSFLDYRPNLSAGEKGRGVYTSFRRGPIEVFLLDTRFFSKAGKSWADPKKPTLIGAQQWAWLQAGLKASTAPFKILASGMIWDGKPGSPESDCWGAYPHERDAVWRWLGENRIEGVILLGGDIHRSRHLRYATKATVGYPLHQFTISPLNDRVIRGTDDPAPEAIAKADEPWVFLKVTADSARSDPQLVAELVNRDGKRFFRAELNASQLRR